MSFSNVKGWKYKEKTFGGHYVVLFIEDKKYENKHLVAIGKSKYEVQNDGHQVKKMLKV